MHGTRAGETATTGLRAFSEEAKALECGHATLLRPLRKYADCDRVAGIREYRPGCWGTVYGDPEEPPVTAFGRRFNVLLCIENMKSPFGTEGDEILAGACHRLAERQRFRVRDLRAMRLAEALEIWSVENPRRVWEARFGPYYPLGSATWVWAAELTLRTAP